ncbi:hypothetical protein I317_04917 [Kwoniella heveanensis CBS 569]|uniref:Late embryogenesis abundant protein LEA-2 subgroup domain-containing protein n=1 Tax=Kwoniella heveanensis BCC8398 TaxID=1296120 RepID=A0A1B9GTV0_9TREE|nr:hypothetical protein I316_04004 [Kwoniella heveanensis BCC8398]OCF41259.1 hypothetical protein I317_04917 [Kwoniella heveanensis CBS 569]
MSRQYNDSYNDPYNQGQYGHGEQQYGHDSQPPPFTANDYGNPYGEEPRYPSYPADPSLGSTEKLPEEAQYENANTQRAQPGRSGLRQPPRSIAEMGPPPRSTGILRMWRKDERGKQWSRGGGVRMSLRMCCCCVTIAIILIVSIILSIVLYVRPPSFALNSVNIGSSPVSLTSDGLTVNFDLSISVANPNWFNANFKEITANARYPGNNTNSFGGGTLYNLDFKGYTASTFDFPFALNYSLAKDPNKVILNDLIKKCGILGGSTQDITVDYDLYLKLKILGVTVSPTISNSASFECPITASDIESIVGSGSLSDLVG